MGLETARAMTPRPLALAAALAAAALAAPPGPARGQGAPASATAGQPRSPAVYPEQRIALRFSHAQHLKLEGVRCTQCHAGVTRSDASSDRLVPQQARCETCHRVDRAQAGEKTDPRSDCAACHPGFDWTVHRAPEGSTFPRPNVVFSHARHLARLGGGDASATDAACERCHGPMGEVELATRAQLPRMATCLECHDGRAASQRCALCHLAAPAGKGAALQTAFASGTLRPGPENPFGLDHGPRFERAHRELALQQRERCAACHAERDCLRCHDGTTKPQSIHPNDYVSIHAVPARQDEPRCASCHRRQTFCVSCHERVGIGANSDPSLLDPSVSGLGRFHPPGWSSSSGGPQHHGVQAARNIGTCASCHREEQCTQCHATTTLNLNPHPPGFASRCRDLAARNARACAKCHILSSPADKAAACL